MLNLDAPWCDWCYMLNLDATGFFAIGGSCQLCDAGFFCVGGNSTAKCPPNTFAPPGASNVSFCACVPGDEPLVRQMLQTRLMLQTRQAS